LRRLEEGKDALDGPRSRLAAVAKIENESGIAHDLATEASWRYVTDAKEFFYLSKQMHSACPWVGGDSVAC